MTQYKTLNKAIDVLECFLDMEEYVELAEIARRSKLDKSTADRIVKTLVKRGFLKQKVNRGKYSLGIKYLDYSGLIKRRSKIRDAAMPHLIELSHLSRESVILCILDGNFAAYNEVIAIDNSLNYIPDEGTNVPLYCTGVGKILLAYMTQAQLTNYINLTTLKPFTQNTITDKDQLRNEIAIVAQDNLAYDINEYFKGVSNVAAGIMNFNGNCVAAVGIIGPSIRLTQYRTVKTAPFVQQCASAISSSLGFKKNDPWAKYTIKVDDSELATLIGCP
jgi:DNA-binding IclR family transcriptional regulator